jgi:hypothetical protein
MKPVAMHAEFVCTSLLFSSGASFRRGGVVFQYRVMSTKNTVFYYPKNEYFLMHLELNGKKLNTFD